LIDSVFCGVVVEGIRGGRRISLFGCGANAGAGHFRFSVLVDLQLALEQIAGAPVM